MTARPAEFGDNPDEMWDDERPDLGPVLIGIGAVLVVGAAIVLMRRRRRRR
ncbi:LPXTG cell wall anchor domain-containing protein [Nonomuraea salmonea]|uniref:LPXTG cell wall anchor domain-containing protein n=1 Tax=Nonomuraea salmonea TaxID=46181 RepID=UPI002FE7FB77